MNPKLFTKVRIVFLLQTATVFLKLNNHRKISWLIQTRHAYKYNTMCIVLPWGMDRYQYTVYNKLG